MLSGALAKKADRLLPKVAKLFERRGIDYCLDGGTLLGLYREGRFLPWDNDIDFFVRGQDAMRIKALKWRLKLMGCKLQRSYAKDDYGPIKTGDARIFKIVTMREYDGQRLQIDLIFKYSDDENYHWVIGVKPPVHKKIHRSFYDAFEALSYKGRDYPVPCKTDDYLTARYGNWRVPVQDYDFKKDDHAIVS